MPLLHVRVQVDGLATAPNVAEGTRRHADHRSRKARRWRRFGSSRRLRSLRWWRGVPRRATHPVSEPLDRCAPVRMGLSIAVLSHAHERSRRVGGDLTAHPPVRLEGPSRTVRHALAAATCGQQTLIASMRAHARWQAEAGSWGVPRTMQRLSRSCAPTTRAEVNSFCGIAVVWALTARWLAARRAPVVLTSLTLTLTLGSLLWQARVRSASWPTAPAATPTCRR